ncbi:hypothetical protein KII05_11810, partial [Weissella confusa]|uniref:hypothetical protein n=1 Tax=Weissella confusa TaxID=1583 RepID=UPI001BD11707
DTGAREAERNVLNPVIYNNFLRLLKEQSTKELWGNDPVADEFYSDEEDLNPDELNLLRSKSFYAEKVEQARKELADLRIKLTKETNENNRKILKDSIS